MCEKCSCSGGGTDFLCPTCGKSLPRDLLVVVPHTEGHVVEAIRRKHPKWVEDNGICSRCYKFYKSQMKGGA